MPFSGAALVAISRTMDYRRECKMAPFISAPMLKCRDRTDHWQDVLVGSMLGVLMAYFSYRQYYPSLSSPLSHRPYSPRIKPETDQGNTGYDGRDGDRTALPIHNQDLAPANRTARPPYHTASVGESYELEEGSTVRRPSPGPYNIWRDGEEGMKTVAVESGSPNGTIGSTTSVDQLIR
jgi:diacylglycerol diphosphate phosphatase / phosphatidate phosphatase